MTAALSLRAVIRPMIVSVFVLLVVAACSKDALAPVPSVTVQRVEQPHVGCVDQDVDDESDGSATSGSVTEASVAPARTEVFEFGDYALFVPACVDAPRALLVALGGPDTRAFVTDKAFGAPLPEVEAALHELGREFRALATRQGLAVIGTSRRSLPNGPASDQLLGDAIRTGAELSGRPQLPIAPMILYGMSGGAPEASGFVARSPERVAGLFLKVPFGVASLTTGNALLVPTYMVQAELDVFVNNAARTADFEANRRAGALWALALERGVIHNSLSPAQRLLTLTWMRSILKRRLPSHPSDALREMSETAGWLGDRATGETWRWAAYPGDRGAASWLPSRATAKQWEDFVAVRE
jgi:hypothetical protein